MKPPQISPVVSFVMSAVCVGLSYASILQGNSYTIAVTAFAAGFALSGGLWAMLFEEVTRDFNALIEVLKELQAGFDKLNQRKD
jgi:uncharacterized membrane protein YhfC